MTLKLLECFLQVCARQRTESESKPAESDLISRIWESDPGADPRARVQVRARFPLDSRVRVQGGVRFAFGLPRARVQVGVRFAFGLDLESESKEESDLLWTGESDRVRVQGEPDLASGKAFT
jgi:hypothetical protein